MASLTLPASPTKPRRSRLQFSLRALFVLLCIAAFPLAWLGNTLYHVRHQRLIVSQIEALGGECHYDYEQITVDDYFYFPLPIKSAAGPTGPVWLRRILGDDAFAHVVWVSFDSYSNVTDDDLRVLPELPRLQYVEIYPTVTDKGLAHVAQLRELRYLKLDTAQVTSKGCRLLQSAGSLQDVEISGEMHDPDECLQQLAGLPNLVSLMVETDNATDSGVARLANCPTLEALHLGFSGAVTDQGVGHLRSLPRLKLLNLQNLFLSDNGLEQISEMRQLRSLFVDDENITDDGLRHLHKMLWLQELQIHGDQITREGATALKEALPNCQLSTSYVERILPQRIKIKTSRRISGAGEWNPAS